MCVREVLLLLALTHSQRNTRYGAICTEPLRSTTDSASYRRVGCSPNGLALDAAMVHSSVLILFLFGVVSLCPESVCAREAIELSQESCLTVAGHFVLCVGVDSGYLSLPP